MEYIVLSYKNRIIHPVDVDRLNEPSNVLEEFIDALDMRPFQEAGTNIRLHTTGTGIGRSNIFQRIELGDDFVRFKALSWMKPGVPGPYVEAHTGDRHWFPQGALLLRWSDNPGDSQTFREIWLDDTHVALETFNGRYVTAENNGTVAELVIDRDVIGEWQQFHYAVPPEGLLPQPSPAVEKPKPVTIEEAVEKLDDGPVKSTGIRVTAEALSKFKVGSDSPTREALRPKFPPG